MARVRYLSIVCMYMAKVKTKGKSVIEIVELSKRNRTYAVARIKKAKCFILVVLSISKP